MDERSNERTRALFRTIVEVGIAYLTSLLIWGIIALIRSPEQMTSNTLRFFLVLPALFLVFVAHFRNRAQLPPVKPPLWKTIVEVSVATVLGVLLLLYSVPKLGTYTTDPSLASASAFSPSCLGQCGYEWKAVLTLAGIYLYLAVFYYRLLSRPGAIQD